jgi:hypothetical protein
MGFKNATQPVAAPSSHVHVLAHVQLSYNQIHAMLLLMYGKILLKLHFDKVCMRTYERK